MGRWLRLRNLRRRNAVDAESEEELRSHIEMAVDDGMRAGLSEAEARRAARLKFGNPLAIRENTMKADVALRLDGVWRDGKFALRQLKRSPGFAVTAIVTLALGIGVNIVVFGVLNAVILHPLNIADPQSVFQIFTRNG